MDLPRLLSPLASPIRERSGSPAFAFPLDGLTFKLILIVACVSLAGVFTSSALVLTLQRNQLVSSAEVTTTRLGNAVETSLEHAMVVNDQAMLTEMAQAMVDRASGEQIRIVDAQGLVRVSSNQAEVGSRKSPTSIECQSCHSGDAQAGGRTVIIPSGSPSLSHARYPVLLNVNPIRNLPRCQTCHDPQESILGVTMIELPLAELDGQMTAAFWRIGIAALLTLVLLIGLMTIALRKYVLHPVGELTRGVMAIRAGCLDTPMRLSTRDELGRLAGAFDAMRQELQSLHTQMERRTQELAMLNELAIEANEQNELQEIIELALNIVVDRLGMQVGNVFLLDPATGELVQRACRGMSEAQRREIESRRHQPGGDLSLQATLSGQEIFVANMANDKRFIGIWDDLEKRSHANVPLKSRGAVLGSLALASHAGQELTDHDVQVLRVVGHELGTAIENAMLLAETRRRERETTALYQLMIKISSSLEMDHVVQAIAEGARTLLDADIGVVALLDEKQRQLSVRACVGNRSTLWHGLAIPVQSIDPDRKRDPLGSIFVANWTADLPIPHMQELVAQEGIASSLAAPMWSNGRLYGYVGVLTRQPRHFTPAETMLFERLAVQTVVAVENAGLYRQVRYMATLEERDRLARELHDNLAQMLGYMNAKVCTAKHWLAGNQIESAFSDLLELERVTDQAYSDVREAIFSLRTIVSSGWELGPTLREYLADYNKRYGIDVQLCVEQEGLFDLTAEAQVQVLRIIQEALTNVRKHSGARGAQVRIRQAGQFTEITVEDDGTGFDAGGTSRKDAHHFGLHIMRERATTVGGTLTVDSAQGHGTRVCLRVPRSDDRDSPPNPQPLP